MNRGLFARGRMMLFLIIIFSLVAGAVGSAWAQEEVEKSTASSETVKKKSTVSEDGRIFFVNEKDGFRVEMAGGWLVGTPSQGAAAVFRAAGESQAQIEFRVSEKVEVDSRDNYISSFQTSLQRVGFVEIEARDRTNYSGRIGSEYEYRVLSEGDEFRLIVWLYAHESEMWIVTGFFPLSKRDAYFRGFQQMLRSLEFTD